jgi:hypothetical protein
MFKNCVWLSSKCGNSKTPKFEKTLLSISYRNLFLLLHSKHWKEKFVNIVEAIRGEFGKKKTRENVSKYHQHVCKQTIEKINWPLYLLQHKTHPAKISHKQHLYNRAYQKNHLYSRSWQHVCHKWQETCTYASKWTTRKVNCSAGEGIRAGFDLETTCMKLSRARFVNSCSIKVDINVRVPTHAIGKAKNVCAWYRNTSSLMMLHFLCMSPLALSKLL